MKRTKLNFVSLVTPFWPRALNICNRCEKFTSHWLLSHLYFVSLIYSLPLMGLSNSLCLLSPPLFFPLSCIRRSTIFTLLPPSLSIFLSYRFFLRPICLALPSLVQPFDTSLDRHTALSPLRAVSLFSRVDRSSLLSAFEKSRLTVKAELLRTRDTCTIAYSPEAHCRDWKFLA